MSKKGKKNTKQEEVVASEQAPDQGAVEASPVEEAPPAVDEPPVAPRGTRSRKSSRGDDRKRAKARRPSGALRAERESILDLEPADEIKPVRAGTHLAAVLELAARPKGATAVELDKAIVTTAKSVRHYGIWALRYALHKNKGFGFRTVQAEGEPARYVLVLPKGQKLATVLGNAAAQERKLALKRQPPKNTRRSNPKASKRRDKKVQARG